MVNWTLEVLSCWGIWVAQPVKRVTSAQVMTSQFVGLSPTSVSVLTAQSLEPASNSMLSSLSAPPPLMRARSLSPSLSKINIKKIIKRNVELLVPNYYFCGNVAQEIS